MAFNELNISFDANLGDAINALANIIHPQRRKLLDQKKKLENASLQSLVKKQNAEALLEEARATTEEAQSQNLLAQAQRLFSEAEKIGAEARKIEAETSRIYLEMATTIVDFIAPDGISPIDKLHYTIKILDILKRDNLTTDKLSLPGGNVSEDKTSPSKE